MLIAQSGSNKCSLNDELTKYGTTTVKYNIPKVIHKTIWCALKTLSLNHNQRKQIQKIPNSTYDFTYIK